MNIKPLIAISIILAVLFSSAASAACTSGKCSCTCSKCQSDSCTCSACTDSCPLTKCSYGSSASTGSCSVTSNTCSTCKPTTCKTCSSCNPNFSYVSYTGHKVSFKYSGSGTPEAYYWNFGDGTISREKAPSHTYKKAGTVKPCLSVKCNGVWVPKTMCKAVNVK